MPSIRVFFLLQLGASLAALTFLVARAQAQTQCCVNPTSETTQQDGEDPTYPYASDFAQTINENLNLKSVTESEGQTATDSCYFSGSKVPPQTGGVQGFTWTIHQDVWGPDIVGWISSGSTDPVAYYRQQDRYPCGFTLHQKLQLNCNPKPYVGPPGNKLTGEIASAIQVENCRYEQLDNSSACQTLNK